MATRTRLSPEQRRAQLLHLGAQLFATQPYEDVHIERVAEMAEVSRGLLYHYFPNKRAFFAALLAQAAEQLAQATTPKPDVGPREQLLDGVESYLRHCAANRLGVSTIHRGAASGDPEIEAILEESTRLHEERILAVLVPGQEPHPLLTLAVRGWLLHLRTVGHEWATTAPDVPVDEVRDMCAGALVGALEALPPEGRPAVLASLISG
ncbi:TetR/AcrR family transcriptional regulator [Mumia sp. ZJ1417]|uniref:TetR/AcrR family transcriptional regulator n=1 Tax=unclassified Mumia TaxID=2621872 RepID=UPI0014249EB0|nr:MULTISPECIES: TetR/AcrR family transcriptional regulator [unclassified Mumia]QMW67374.1 TetR/AcrR family transcriptional regulator [Mumia sp. ZJ1417]